MPLKSTDIVKDGCSCHVLFIFTKLGMLFDTVEIWFEIANR